MFAAAADLGTVAGGMSFDAGRHVAAQRTFVSPLRAAAEAKDQALDAHILQCMARQMSHLGHVEEALKLVVLEQYGARWQMTCATASMLAVLESQFQAILGIRRRATLLPVERGIPSNGSMPAMSLRAWRSLILLS